MDYRTIRPARFNQGAGAEPAIPASELLLDDVELRVVGSLVEKETTTPDYYPLTLNALVSACNQKSSRDPVVSYSSDEVSATLDALREKDLATEIRSSDGGRVARYRHLFLERFQLNRREAAVLCVLILRGHQTSGEIRGRSSRLYEFESLAEVEQSIALLSQEEPRPFVIKLPRAPGTKESSYAHQLGGELDVSEMPVAEPVTSREPRTDRMSTLQQELDDVKQRLSDLERQFEDFRRLLE